MFLFQVHTLSHSWTLRAARAFFILGNPSLVLKSPPGVPPSMLQPRQHHSRPTLIQPLVALLSLSRQKRTPIFCVTGKQAKTIQPQPPKFGDYSLDPPALNQHVGKIKTHLVSITKKRTPVRNTSVIVGTYCRLVPVVR